jgi:hypothetical protein
VQQLVQVHFERLAQANGVRHGDSPRAGLQRADALPDPPESVARSS